MFTDPQKNNKKTKEDQKLRKNTSKTGVFPEKKSEKRKKKSRKKVRIFFSWNFIFFSLVKV
jgi:hypothetical protein